MASNQYIYVMKGLGKAYPGGKEVMKDIWLSFLPGAKIGVLGLNGSGKSTLMRIMAGIDTEFTGEAWAADGVKIGYLSQEPHLDETKNALENAMDGVGAASAVGLRCVACCSPSPICCCSMNRRTIWTPSLSVGWKPSLKSIPEPSWL